MIDLFLIRLNLFILVEISCFVELFKFEMCLRNMYFLGFKTNFKTNYEGFNIHFSSLNKTCNRHL